MTQTGFVFGDAADAAEYWRHREWKKWAVDVAAGPAKRPTYKTTLYVRARSQDAAVECAKRNVTRNPNTCRFHARLAGPKELGCVATPGFPVSEVNSWGHI